METQLGKDGQGINYIVVEMVNKSLIEQDKIKKSSDFDKGLFEGIYIKSLDENIIRKYIVLNVSPKETHIFDLEFYNILSIEIHDGITKEYLFACNNEKDQEKIFLELADILNNLRDANRVLEDSDIIKLDTYSNIPDAIEGSESSSSNNYDNYMKRNKEFYSSDYYTNYNYNKKKEPLFYERQDKLPHGNTLKALVRRLEAQAKGTYTPPKLPKTDDSEEVFIRNNNVKGYWRD